MAEEIKAIFAVGSIAGAAASKPKKLDAHINAVPPATMTADTGLSKLLPTSARESANRFTTRAVSCLWASVVGIVTQTLVSEQVGWLARFSRARVVGGRVVIKGGKMGDGLGPDSTALDGHERV